MSKIEKRAGLGTKSTGKRTGTRPHPTWVDAEVPPYRCAYKRPLDTRPPPQAGAVHVCMREETREGINMAFFMSPQGAVLSHKQKKT